MSRVRLYGQLILPYAAWWLFWGIMQTLVLHRLNLEWSIAWPDALLTVVVLALCGYVIINTYRFYIPGSGNYIYRFAYIVAIALISTAGTQWILKQLFHNHSGYIEFLNYSMPLRYMFSLLMIAFVAVVSWLRFYMKEQEKSKRRKDEAEQLLREAELSKLRQQLQPHFLFNSLNSISALVGSPADARKMIQQLSDFLRGTLRKDEQQSVNFSEELKHLQLYLAIEKVRFGDRLTTQIDCAEETGTMKIPSLLLQPVVENAIKFGLYDTTGQVTIYIRAWVADQFLVAEVENPFDPSTSKPRQGTGFGLESLRRRLHLLFGRNDLLSVEQRDSVFITTIKIPQAK